MVVTEGSTRKRRFDRPFLKWAGNKYQILKWILERLPSATRLIEPFAGSGAVFLNTNYERYLICDINPDLINLYQTLKTSGEDFIQYCKRLFIKSNNTEDGYYRLRRRFNATDDAAEKSALLVYLNRHGYNGLVRYNADSEFNVPFGRYRSPYFPLQEMRQFHAKARRAVFVCEDFRKAMARARRGAVVYADPPYVPLSPTSNFTSYARCRFGLAEQQALAWKAQQLARRGIPVLISNHNTPFTRTIYESARLTQFPVQRYISCKGNERREALELLALFDAHPDIGPG